MLLRPTVRTRPYIWVAKKTKGVPYRFDYALNQENKIYKFWGRKKGQKEERIFYLCSVEQISECKVLITTLNRYLCSEIKYSDKKIFTPVWNFSRTSIRKHFYMGVSFSFPSKGRDIVNDFMIIPSRTNWNVFIKINFTWGEGCKLQRGPFGQTLRLLRLSTDVNYHHPADLAH